MAEVDVEAVLAGLKGFQRDAVEHVMERLYRAPAAERSNRFLVADETGLGKSIIARGVIARTIEHLEIVDEVDRINVVYVCSNADLANQNLKRLNVLGDECVTSATRLSLLALESASLTKPASGRGKKVNLVSFTPGTSFSEGGWRQGEGRERALLTIILNKLVNVTCSDRRTTRLIMQGAVKTLERFATEYVLPMEQNLAGSLDLKIVDAFTSLIQKDGTLDEFLALREDARGRQLLGQELWERAANMTGRMRQSLALASVDSLEPDLIILDEFQRFKHLLDPTQDSQAAELAHELFTYEHARVLLLSATPYKPFTQHGEDEDHSEDFLKTVEFLTAGDPEALDEVRNSLSGYRRSLIADGNPAGQAARVRSALVPFMTRSERPALGERDDLVTVTHLPVAPPTDDDLVHWVALRELSHEIGNPIDLDYWKSIPYFASFMEGYKPSRSVANALNGPHHARVRAALEKTQRLPEQAIRAFDAIELGNGKLRALAERTVDAGWWKLLWMPATMPYLKPGRVFEPLSDGSVTKQVVFSAWNGTPTAVAALLSYEADRRVAGDKFVMAANTPEARQQVVARLRYGVNADGRPVGLSALALFWPHVALAEAGDPLASARTAGRRPPADELNDAVTELLTRELPPLPAAAQAYDAYFAWPGALPDSLEGKTAEHLIGVAVEDQSDRFLEHVRHALDTPPEKSTHDDLARLAAHAPGNIAWRAVGTVAGSEVTRQGRWDAAMVLARGLRNLFNRPESTTLLITLYGDERPYWQSVLEYCADGNLQAVLDEYLFQLHSESSGKDLDDDDLLAIAAQAVDAMGLRRATYLGHDPASETATVPLSARFALRYGGSHAAADDEKSGVRQSVVRASFNSPFAPFVLASTSVGQEGIDFHWWSHAVVHWNLPGNPVDFEQREGRVNRFAGHAIRKNVAEAHWGDVLAAHDSQPWRTAFTAAEEQSARSTDLGEFAPWWVYPGPARIHRVLANYPLSRDESRYEQLRSDLTLYRLTLGQPRQDDMVRLMASRGVDGTMPTIDLRPPRHETNER